MSQDSTVYVLLDLTESDAQKESTICLPASSILGVMDEMSPVDPITVAIMKYQFDSILDRLPKPSLHYHSYFCLEQLAKLGNEQIELAQEFRDSLEVVWLYSQVVEFFDFAINLS